MIYTFIINSIGVYITGKLLDGVQLKSFWTAMIVAILLAIINSFVKPLIIFLTLPLTIITLGLFILVINAFMLMLVDAMVDGFKIRSFGWAVIFSIILSILNSILFWIF